MILKVENLYKSFVNNFTTKNVLKGVSLSLQKGKALGLIGKSGCGKTTAMMCIAGLYKFEKGNIYLNGKSLNNMKSKCQNIWIRTNIQLIFQNPGSSLHPKKRIKKIFKESVYHIHKLTKKQLNNNFIYYMEKVDLKEKDLNKFPRDFSGGEKQRIAIARALLVKPTLLIADEPVSNLDVTTQAKILNLFKALNKEGQSIIFISHNIASAHYLCDEINIMEDGIINKKFSKYETSDLLKFIRINNENEINFHTLEDKKNKK